MKMNLRHAKISRILRIKLKNIVVSGPILTETDTDKNFSFG